jgi:hypothetical protein
MQGYPPWAIRSEHTRLDFVCINYIEFTPHSYAWRSTRHSGGVAEWWCKLVVPSQPGLLRRIWRVTSTSGLVLMNFALSRRAL